MNTTPKFSRLDPGQRREQILDAANALFSERAYDEVSVEDIANSAGSAPPSKSSPAIRRQILEGGRLEQRLVELAALRSLISDSGG